MRPVEPLQAIDDWALCAAIGSLKPGLIEKRPRPFKRKSLPRLDRHRLRAFQYAEFSVDQTHRPACDGDERTGGSSTRMHVLGLTGEPFPGGLC